MQSVYNGWLVALSIGVAILASYTALDFAGRIVIAEPRRRVIWLAGGAVTMGVGIWSMHFIGMLAFALPIPLGYDVSITALSLVIAIAVSFFASAWRRVRRWGGSALSKAACSWAPGSPACITRAWRRCAWRRPSIISRLCVRALDRNRDGGIDSRALDRLFVAR